MHAVFNHWTVHYTPMTYPVSPLLLPPRGCRWLCTQYRRSSAPGSHWCSPPPPPPVVPTTCPSPLSPSLSPHSGNRVNPLAGPQSVSGSGGSPHTKERNTPISPHHQHSATLPTPICRIVMFPSFSPLPPPPLKFRVIIIACVALNATIYFSAHGFLHVDASMGDLDIFNSLWKTKVCQFR